MRSDNSEITLYAKGYFERSSFDTGLPVGRGGNGIFGGGGSGNCAKELRVILVGVVISASLGSEEEVDELLSGARCENTLSRCRSDPEMSNVLMR